jgi:drug/metabolite transporter (DMT)-like permease
MALSALLLALAAAVVHAGWNLLLARAPDVHSATAVAAITGVVLLTPLSASHWRFDTHAIPFSAASSTLELAYIVLLASAYSVAEMSVVYPVARGTAPVLVTVIGAIALGQTVSAVTVLGILMVAGGIVLVRGLGGHARRRDVVLALAVGACIAGYTLVDDRGLGHAGALSYLQVVFTATAVAYLAGVICIRGAAAVRTAVSWTTILAGAGFTGSYALTLLALERSPAAPVAAVRETSVLLATAFAVIVLHESVTKDRLAGAVCVVVGVAAVALG